jgi:hypothetical protein
MNLRYKERICLSWKDQGSRPVQANSSRDPISKITRAKWTGGMAQVVECLLFKTLLWKHEALSSNLSHQNKTKITQK